MGCCVDSRNLLPKVLNNINLELNLLSASLADCDGCTMSPQLGHAWGADQVTGPRQSPQRAGSTMPQTDVNTSSSSIPGNKLQPLCGQAQPPELSRGGPSLSL